MPRQCPDCDLPLNVVTMKGVTVDTCPRCAGIFFDEGEINQLRLDGNDALSELDEKVQPVEDFTIDFQHHEETRRACANCRQPMDKVRYLYHSPIMLDSCPICNGVWVENGELEHMKTVLEAETNTTSVRAQAYVAMSALKERTDADSARVKRLERAMRILNRRTNY